MAFSAHQIEQRFGHHAAATENPKSPEAHANLRALWVDFAKYLDNILADGRSKSIAFTELETAAMWTHKALARTLADEEEDKK